MKFIFRNLNNDCKNYIIDFLDVKTKIILKYNIPKMKIVIEYKKFIKLIENINFNKKLDILIKYPLFEKSNYIKFGDVYLENFCYNYYWNNPINKIPKRKFDLKIVFNEYLHFENLKKKNCNLNILDEFNSFYIKMNRNKLLDSLHYSNKSHLMLLCKINGIKKISRLNKKELIQQLLKI